MRLYMHCFLRKFCHLCVVASFLFPFWMVPTTSHPITGWGVFLLGFLSCLSILTVVLKLERFPAMVPWLLVLLNLLVMAFPLYKNGILRMLVIFGCGALSTPFLWWSLRTIATRLPSSDRELGRNSPVGKATSKVLSRNCAD
ncbi:hypothetical protein KP509_04G007700 [Ceratopteris richardii]|uniref:Uncharacterized protein n=1 Tax=Ceratopteris richardii TaxID=49495 RepID=A0A8T2UU37_CERRI|nr:hypothetical protein KP509_04G007700 [Ceratopteris richardii]